MCIHEFCHHKVLTKLFTGVVTGDAYFGDTFYAIPRSSSISVLGFEHALGNWPIFVSK